MTGESDCHFAGGRRFQYNVPILNYLAGQMVTLEDTVPHNCTKHVLWLGKSQEAKTYMGYKFAEDVVASMLLMHEHYGQKSFLLFYLSYKQFFELHDGFSRT